MRTRLVILVACAVAAADCDYVLNLTGPTVTTTNNNTNTNTNSNDLSDLIDFNPTTGGGCCPGNTSPGGPDAPLAFPAAAQAQARAFADANPALLRYSCQDTHGPSAWAFLDRLVAVLASHDPRWGYVCKYGNCADISRDVIGYRATADHIGAWAIDVIADHCGVSPAFSWNVLGFDPATVWRGFR